MIGVWFAISCAPLHSLLDTMPASKKITSIFKSFGQQLESVLSDLSQALSLMILRPFTRGWRASKTGGVEWKFQWSHVVLWPVSLIVSMLSVFIRILISPAELLLGLSPSENHGRPVDDSLDHCFDLAGSFSVHRRDQR